MRRIVVGVDGSLGSALAVSWAVDECSLHRTALLIAHCPDLRDARTAAIQAEAGMRAVDRRAEQILASFAHAASIRRSSVPVSTLISHSDALNALIDLSVDSELLVLGSHGSGLLGQDVSRATSTLARCPVLVIPAAPGDSTGVVSAVVHVVVGDPTDGPAQRFASREAELRGVPVRSVAASAALERLDTEVLTVVGRGHLPGPWSTHPGLPADRLLDRRTGPVVVVGPMTDGPSDLEPGAEHRTAVQFSNR